MDQQQPVQPVQNSPTASPKFFRSLWWVGAAVVIFALAGVGVYGYQHRTLGYKDCANVNSQSVDTTFTYAGKDGKTALELLKEKYPKTSTKTAEGLGEYVTGINCREASSTEYWQFFANGTSSEIGAGTYTTKSADTLEWKLTSF